MPIFSLPHTGHHHAPRYLLASTEPQKHWDVHERVRVSPSATLSFASAGSRSI